MTVSRKHSKTGMKKGKIKMKKLMILAAVAAMAFGAKAEDWTFSLDIGNITRGPLSRDTVWYLMDKNTQVIYAYAKTSWFNEEPDSISGHKLMNDDMSNSWEQGGNGDVVDGHAVATHTIYKDGSYVYNEQTDAHGLVCGFKLVFDNTTDDFHTAVENKNLVAVLHDPTEPAYIDQFAVTKQGGYTSNQLVATGDYRAIPEPTSAMLLLLGMAGLALKRKVA